jgi:hypothetical protein
MGAVMSGDVLFLPYPFQHPGVATMRAMLRGIVGLGVFALLAGPAFAQGRGFGMFGGRGGIAMLIGNASVQSELKLDDQQKEKAKEVADKNREKFQAARQGLEGLEGEERRTKFQELAKEVNESTLKAIGEFMKPEQITRLKQISYQERGAPAFSDPEVATKLNLTDSQKGDIKTIVDESNEQMRDLRQQFQDDREGAMKKMAEIRKATLEKVTAKLNDEQQKQWKELIGAPFEVKYEPRPNN